MFLFTLLPSPSLGDQDFDEARISPDEMGIDSGFLSRRGLPCDSPVRPELRPKYEFVIATDGGCDGASKFSHAFRDAKPLQNWGHERHCDLCNQKCKNNLFLLRCFDRTSRPFRLHKALIYAGPECSKALLREKRRFRPEPRQPGGLASFDCACIVGFVQVLLMVTAGCTSRQSPCIL